MLFIVEPFTSAFTFMTRLAKALHVFQIPYFPAILNRYDMVHDPCSNQIPILKANLAKGINPQLPFPYFSPCPATVKPLRELIPVKPIICLPFLFLMFFTKPVLCQSWTSLFCTRLFRFIWHHYHPQLLKIKNPSIISRRAACL